MKIKASYPWNNCPGTCEACGKRTQFIFNDRQELARNHAVYAQCHCVACHGHLAICILEAFASKGIRSLGDFSKRREMHVFNTSTRSAVDKALKAVGTTFSPFPASSIA